MNKREEAVISTTIQQFSNSAIQQKREIYIAPQVEIIEMETEGSILKGSNEVPGIGDGGGAWR